MRVTGVIKRVLWGPLQLKMLDNIFILSYITVLADIYEFQMLRSCTQEKRSLVFLWRLETK